MLDCRLILWKMYVCFSINTIFSEVIKPRDNKLSGRRNWKSEIRPSFQLGNMIRIVGTTNRKQEHIIKFYS